MEPIKKIQLTDDVYVDIVYDEDNESPRKWDNISKLCIREHRRYDFPNELKINFDDLNSYDDYEVDDNYQIIETVGQHEQKKLEGYHMFWLDCYEHSGISFSLSGTGMQCQFDTSRKCGLIAIPKHFEWDNGPGYSGSVDYTEAEAEEMAKADIEIYNQYMNGEVYGFRLMQSFEPIIWSDSDGRQHEYKADDECLDSCYGIYDQKEIAEHLPKEYREKFLKEI